MAFILNRRSRDQGDVQPSSQSENVRQLLSAADVARDNRRWADAARFYRQYLAQRVEEAPIWVQLGHALKESGNLGEAETAYEKSLSLAPEVADTHLQLGHLYKRMRNFSGAIAAYREAARLDDMLVDARQELAEFGIGSEDLPLAQRSAGPRQPMTFVDLSDLFFNPDQQAAVSDIQRFELGLANAIVATSAEHRPGIQFLSEAHDRPCYVVIDAGFVGELASVSSGDEIEHVRLRSIARSAASRGRRYQPIAGDVLLILGEFWVSETLIERIIDLGRQSVRIGVLIHDTTPISHPEFCTREFVEAFRSGLSAILRVADFVLCVSEHSARAIEDFAVESRIAPATIRTLKPSDVIADDPVKTTHLSNAVARLLKEKYVLYVSPIEAAANHAYLLRIWKRLTQRGGGNVPQLVFVGRPGWRGDEILSQVEATGDFNGQVVTLTDLSGAELAMLYRSALFTVFPSIADGWASPVAASLVHGRPCVASSSGSVSEIAGDFVDYVDPFNDSDGYEKMLRLVEDPEYLEQRALRIRESFTPREWHEVAADAIAIIRTLREGWGDVAKTVEPPRATPGQMHRFGHHENIPEFLRSGDSAFVQFACDLSWDAVESFGRWMRGRSGRIAFASEARETAAILVMIEVFTVAGLEAVPLRIGVNGTNYPVIRVEAGARRFLLLHATADNGQVAVEFDVDGEIAAGIDEREYLWFGVASIGYAPGGDALARVMLLEEAMTGMSNLTTIKPLRAFFRSDPLDSPPDPPAAEQHDEP
jgi:glycosyltransferase involved in cell wall biosynthesis